MSLGLHRTWKRYLLELAGLERGFRVLDLATGTGDLALGAAGTASATPLASVVAADFTPEMMRVGRQRPGAASIQWMSGDALDLPFPDASFDRVLVGYGLRNFADLSAGLREILRCLRPGGRLLSLDFGKPGSPVLRQLYYRYLEASTTAVGWLLHRDVEAYLYIPESLRRYPAQRELIGLMQGTGFVRCGFLELLFGTMAINFGERPLASAS